LEDAKKYTSIVDIQLNNFKECFTNANKTISNFVNYLVTTRGMLKNLLKITFNNMSGKLLVKKNSIKYGLILLKLKENLINESFGIKFLVLTRYASMLKIMR